MTQRYQSCRMYAAISLSSFSNSCYTLLINSFTIFFKSHIEILCIKRQFALEIDDSLLYLYATECSINISITHIRGHSKGQKPTSPVSTCALGRTPQTLSCWRRACYYIWGIKESYQKMYPGAV